MKRTQKDKALAERWRIASKRAAYRETLAITWLAQNHPDIWRSIQEEAEKKFPLLLRRQQIELPESLTSNGAKP